MVTLGEVRLPERRKRVISAEPSWIGPRSYSMDSSVADQTQRGEKDSKSAETKDYVV